MKDSPSAWHGYYSLDGGATWVKSCTARTYGECWGILLDADLSNQGRHIKRLVLAAGAAPPSRGRKKGQVTR